MDERVRSDRELYLAWQGGDVAAGGSLVDRHLAGLGRFFANKVFLASDAEDLVASTFEICARKLGDWTGASSFRAYVFGIAHNVLRNYLRSKRRSPRDVDPSTDSIAELGPSPATLLDAHREQRLLLSALRSIPIEHQIVLELNYFEAMTRNEIAETLGEPPGTIASRIRAARALLEAALTRLADDAELVDSTLTSLDAWVERVRERLGRRRS